MVGYLAERPSRCHGRSRCQTSTAIACIAGQAGRDGATLALGLITTCVITSLLEHSAVPTFARLPAHVGFIPDGNRRWATSQSLAKRAGYAAGLAPGLRLLTLCRTLGIAEASVYGFTKENVHRAKEQVAAFRGACIEFACAATRAGAALRAVGDTDSAFFPHELRPYADERSPGDIRVNLLVNYGWTWDLAAARGRRRRTGHDHRSGDDRRRFATQYIPRIDLVVRWGGRRRLSGFLPIQCAYADLYVLDTLWPDSRPEEFLDALAWYQEQDVTLGG